MESRKQNNQPTKNRLLNTENTLVVARGKGGFYVKYEFIMLARPLDLVQPPWEATQISPQAIPASQATDWQPQASLHGFSPGPGFSPVCYQNPTCLPGGSLPLSPQALPVSCYSSLNPAEPSPPPHTLCTPQQRRTLATWTSREPNVVPFMWGERSSQPLPYTRGNRLRDQPLA